MVFNVAKQNINDVMNAKQNMLSLIKCNKFVLGMTFVPILLEFHGNYHVP
jgi:hypothetical protein